MKSGVNFSIVLKNGTNKKGPNHNKGYQKKATTNEFCDTRIIPN